MFGGRFIIRRNGFLKVRRLVRGVLMRSYDIWIMLGGSLLHAGMGL
jgi:hypothetical protein